MPFATSADGTGIHYDVQGTGPFPLIFLHGWGGNARTWDAVLSHLDPARFRAITLDIRGHGQSERPPTGFTWMNFDQDVFAVADQEQVTQFVSVGFSMGGKLACHLAARHPQRIPAQVLVAPVGPGLVPIEREAGLKICRAADDEQKNRDIFGAWFGPRATDAMIAACCATIASTPVFVLEATAEMTLWTSIEPIVDRTELPTLLVLGQSDPVYGQLYQRENMLPFLNNVQTVSLPSGHFIPLEAPARLAELTNECVPKLFGR